MSKVNDSLKEKLGEKMEMLLHHFKEFKSNSWKSDTLIRANAKALELEDILCGEEFSG